MPMCCGLVHLAPVLLLTLAAAGAPAFAQTRQIDIERPGEREFVRDLAGMIDEADEGRIRQIADRLLADKATPVIVVTIGSMADHGGRGLELREFARLVFDQWGVGHASLRGHPWNTGILLIVSRDDRQAWIELGGGWVRAKDAEAQRIMDQQIIPRFRAGAFSGGIVAGVESLDRMARDLALPDPPINKRSVSLWVALAGLAVFTAVSLARRGTRGWAWVFWGVVFGILAAVLYQMGTSSGGRGGGGFSGGSFGGGTGGGGGAGGSW